MKNHRIESYSVLEYYQSGNNTSINIFFHLTLAEYSIDVSSNDESTDNLSFNS